MPDQCAVGFSLKDETLKDETFKDETLQNEGEHFLIIVRTLPNIQSLIIICLFSHQTKTEIDMDNIKQC